MRAFSIAMAAAITVIIATQLGLPVSSTHIAVGAVFGVGFLREYLKRNYARMLEQIQLHHLGRDKTDVEIFLEEFRAANLEGKSHMLQQLKEHSADADLSKKERARVNRNIEKYRKCLDGIREMSKLPDALFSAVELVIGLIEEVILERTIRPYRLPLLLQECKGAAEVLRAGFHEDVIENRGHHLQDERADLFAQRPVVEILDDTDHGAAL